MGTLLAKAAVMKSSRRCTSTVTLVTHRLKLPSHIMLKFLPGSRSKSVAGAHNGGASNDNARVAFANSSVAT